MSSTWRGNTSRALQLADTDNLRAVVLADLAYLDLLQGRTGEAREKLTQAAQLASADDQVILRVAHWNNGRVVPDPERYPTAFMPVRTGIKANFVTAELGRGNPAQARLLAEELIAESSDSLWGPKCLGWVLEPESRHPKISDVSGLTTTQYAQVRDRWSRVDRAFMPDRVIIPREILIKR